jgi:hypothetical protein
MSEMGSVETCREARQETGKIVVRLVQMIAVAAMLGGLLGAIYLPRSASLIVAFFAFVAYLLFDHASRR